MPTLLTVGVNQVKNDFIAQLMDRGDLKADFPDDAQRLAVAHSMYARKNAATPEAEHPWPKKYVCNFIEPGLCWYQDLGECKVCGDEATCEKRLRKPCDTPGEWVLVTQEALARMAKSFEGKPVIDVAHADVKGSTIADGDADGIVTRVWFDAATAWWMCEFIVWNPDTQEHCESLAYSVSCAYDPTDIAGAGRYHSSDYQEEVKDGVYTHLAVVTNPRYEKARITLSNSKGGSMAGFNWKFWKGERKNAAPLDPAKEMVNVDGKDVPLQELYDALPEEPKEEPKFNDETSFDTPKGQKSLGDLKNAYRAKMKKNADDAMCPSCKGSGKKNSEAPGEKQPLPDLRDPKQNAEEEAAKKAKEEGESAAFEKAETERKNAEDAAAKKAADDKAAEEKKNADDAAAKKAADDKAAEEKKNADDAAAKKAEDDKKAEERRNSGKAAFRDLRNTASSRQGDAVQPVATKDDRLAAGASRYGSAK